MKYLQFENKTPYRKPYILPLLPYLLFRPIHSAMIKSFSSLCNESVVFLIICRGLLSISKKKSLILGITFSLQRHLSSNTFWLLFCAYNVNEWCAEEGKRQNPKKRNNVVLPHGRNNISYQTNKNEDDVDGFFHAQPFFPSKEKTHTHTNVVDRIAVVSSKKYMVRYIVAARMLSSLEVDDDDEQRVKNIPFSLDLCVYVSTCFCYCRTMLVKGISRRQTATTGTSFSQWGNFGILLT